MLFNSVTFLIFLGLFFALWPILRHRPLPRYLYIVLASFVFYGWWDYRYVPLLAASGLINFGAGVALARFPGRKKPLLALSLAANLGVLGTFKYLNFGIANVNGLLALFGMSEQIPLAHLALPIGISFYTFRAMSYTIDVYRGQLSPTRNVLHFLAYLSLFPQLLAGPIQRAGDLLAQLAENRGTLGEERRWRGTRLVVFGYFKKVVVADTLAPVVNAAFGAASPEPSAAYWWIVAVMFAYQIYCDFSGYTDIARGLGQWMGYDCPDNFDHPYIAGSFREFWQRWHISLSSWFRDYVYIPLGGSRRGAFRSHVNLWITILLSGLWHGATWAFLLWGGLHAFYLSLERLTRWPEKLTRLPAGRHLTVLAVFILTVIAWIFFRAGSQSGLSSLEQIRCGGTVLATMFDLTHLNVGAIGAHIDSAAFYVLGIIVLRQLYFHFRLNERAWPVRQAALWAKLEPVLCGFLIMTCVFMRGPGTQFIYFRF